MCMKTAATRMRMRGLSGPMRMAKVYQETAASITITSLTDTLSFLVGIITPIPAVRIFCIYISMSIIFTYLWHITFFGGLLSLAGYVEKANKHSLTGIKVLPRSLSGKLNRPNLKYGMTYFNHHLRYR